MGFKCNWTSCIYFIWILKQLDWDKIQTNVRYSVHCVDSREGPSFKHTTRKSFEFNTLFPLSCCLQNSDLQNLFIYFLFRYISWILLLNYLSWLRFILPTIAVPSMCDEYISILYINIIRVSICKCSGAKKKYFLPGRDPNQLPPCSQFDVFSLYQLGPCLQNPQRFGKWLSRSNRRMAQRKGPKLGYSVEDCKTVHMLSRWKFTVHKFALHKVNSLCFIFRS
jgi:hypothetical protein